MLLTAYAFERILSDMWDVEVTNELERWYESLTDDEQDSVNAAVDLLEEHGPALRRPVVGQISGSKLKNLKELIPAPGNLRILFVFDPRRTAILLVGGDKTGNWKAWYDEMIPIAEHLYEEHLEELRRERVLP
jgi:hypothetical protein